MCTGGNNYLCSGELLRICPIQETDLLSNADKALWNSQQQTKKKQKPKRQIEMTDL